MATTHLITDEQLLELPDDGSKYEVVDGELVRTPDVSFVATGRLDTQTEHAFPELAPDLAIEVVSPDDRPREILDKVREYLQAGVRLVWVIEPKRRQATAYRGLTDVRVIDAAGSLDGEDLLRLHVPVVGHPRLTHTPPAPAQVGSSERRSEF